jgi:hypothetical protein
MSADQKAPTCEIVADATEGLATLLERAVAELRQRRPRTWIEQFRAGLVLRASEAANVAGVDAQTIRRWCEATENTDRPLGFLVGRLWLVDAYELLHQVEVRDGLHARRVAESRLKEHWERLSRSPQSLELPERVAG